MKIRNYGATLNGGFNIKTTKKSIFNLIFCIFVFLNVLPCYCVAQENVDDSATRQSADSSQQDDGNKDFGENKNPEKEEKKPDKQIERNSSKPDKADSKKGNSSSKNKLHKENNLIPEKPEGDLDKSKDQFDGNFNLPVLAEEDYKSASNAALPESKNSERDLTKTITAWLLMVIGFLIIIITIILNFFVPKKANFRYHSRHSAKSKRRKNRYQIKL